MERNAKRARTGEPAGASEAPPPPPIVLLRGENFAVLQKRASIPCHKDDFVGKLSDIDGGLPLLQLGRNALGANINLVHRLDRGASGCVLVAFSAHQSATAELQAAMRNARKTYVAFTRGRGELGGENLQERGWFNIDRPIKDRKGKESDARTAFRFVAATAPPAVLATAGAGSSSEAKCSETVLPVPRASVVLCRPETGRWHQIRRHLNGLSHPILGDGEHGNSKTNREWRNLRGLPSARLCLHLARMEIPETSVTPAIDVSCPLPADIRNVFQLHTPGMLTQSYEALLQEAKIKVA